MKQRTVLAIETSCDETAAAVYQTGHGVRSSVLFSQIDLHRQFGGVVPEIASRSHIEKIGPIVHEALDTAGKTLDEIDDIAVTNSPGLPGSLLVGLAYAKALAYAARKNLVAVNHIEGHIFSALIEQNVPFPHLCLTASGGHTSLYLVEDFGNYTEIGTTQDDAAGEAFDKVAKLLGLGYPGGPIIEQLAQEIGFEDRFNYPRMRHASTDFSFSGLKTAVLYDLTRRGAYDLKTKRLIAGDDRILAQSVSSSFLVCVGDILTNRIAHAYQQYPQIKALTFVGGVACNRYLAERITIWGQENGITTFVPARKYCTDNAAMIAFVGHYRAQRGEFASFTLDMK